MLSNFEEILSKFLDAFDAIGKKMTVAQIIVFGFVVVILSGGILLYLPISQNEGFDVSFLDSLFTAASATCVTGLVVVNTAATWSGFGKFVILCLIQVGGLGFMSLITVLYLLLGKKISLKDRLIIRDSFNQNNVTGMVKLVKQVVIGTLIFEGIGAVILSIAFYLDGIEFYRSIKWGIFHSISAFCNAGFDIIGSTSLESYVTNTTVNITLMLLIIIGGIGFAVWLDIEALAKRLKYEKFSFYDAVGRLTVHTKMVLIITAILLVFGAFFTFLVEFNNPATLGSLSFGDKVLASAFNSVTLRTAGFNTISQKAINDGTKFLSIIFMTIGGSPGGTAGGMKTATIGVLFAAVFSAIKGEENIIVFRRKIGINILQKALAVVILNIFIIVTATIILCISETGIRDEFRFIDLFYEVASAVGTVGLTTGVTPNLTVVGKIVIIVCIFLGRLGSVTTAVAFTSHNSGVKGLIKYPETNILVG